MGFNFVQVIRAYPLRAIAILVPLLAVIGFVAYGPAIDLYDSFIAWIFGEQRAFHKSMTTSLSAFADGAGISTGFAIVSGSFLYGVFHAAGPGHGKVILSTYLLTQPEQVRKSVFMSVAAAFMQGVMAVLLVYGLFYVFGLVARDSKVAVAWSERLAFLMVIGVGLILVWRAVRGLGWLPSGVATDAHHHPHHDHDHHGAEGDVCATCGHSHTPSAAQLVQANDWRTTASIIVSIGLRPCSGAVLVLVFAKFAGIPIAGVLAVAAISVGTAITVSAMAILSVQARKLAVSLMEGASGVADKAGYAVALIGGMVLIIMGYGLFQATFSTPIRSMGL